MGAILGLALAAIAPFAAVGRPGVLLNSPVVVVVELDTNGSFIGFAASFSIVARCLGAISLRILLSVSQVLNKRKWNLANSLLSFAGPGFVEFPKSETVRLSVFRPGIANTILNALGNARQSFRSSLVFSLAINDNPQPTSGKEAEVIIAAGGRRRDVGQDASIACHILE